MWKHTSMILAILILVLSIVCLGISDSKVSIANTGIPDDEVASSVSEVGNSDSESATITITMRTAPLPEE